MSADAEDEAEAEEAPQGTTGSPVKRKKRAWQKVDTATYYQEWLEANPAPPPKGGRGKSKAGDWRAREGKGAYADGEGGGPRGKGKGGGGGYGGTDEAPPRPEDAAKPLQSSQGDLGGPSGDGFGSLGPTESDPAQPAGDRYSGGKLGPVGGKSKKQGGCKGRDGALASKGVANPLAGPGSPTPGSPRGPSSPSGGCQTGKGFVGGPRGCPGSKGAAKGPRGGLQVGVAGMPLAAMPSYSPYQAAPAPYAGGGGGGYGGSPSGSPVSSQVPYGSNAPGMMAVYAFPGYFLMPGASGATSYSGGAGAAGMCPLPQVPMTHAGRQEVKQKVQTQIEYYFGQDNLIKDTYLRSRMNEEGWVPIILIADFRCVKGLTTDMSIILEAITSSSKLEIDPQGAHVRLRSNWQEWLLSLDRTPMPSHPTDVGASGVPGAAPYS